MRSEQTEEALLGFGEYWACWSAIPALWSPTSMPVMLTASQFTQIIEADPDPFVISAFVVAELDYLVGTRRGVDAELAVLTELAGGAWELAAISAGLVLTDRAWRGTRAPARVDRGRL